MYANRTIRVAATESNPYVLFDQSTGTWSGILISFLQAACHRLSYRCEIFVSSPDPGNHKLFDEVLLGIFGDVHNGTFDLGVSPVSITAKRFRNFSFVDSFLRRTYVAVIHQDNLITANPSEFIFHLLQVLLPNEMWMSICGVFCVVILFGTFSEFLDNPDNEATCGKFAWLQVCIKRLFRTLGTGLGIHGIEDFEGPIRIQSWRISKVIFSSIWLIYTFFILSTLVSTLPLIFAFEINQKLPFSTVKQLLDSSFVTYGSPTIISTLNVSKTAFYAPLARKMQILPDETNNQTKLERYVALAKADRNVLIMDLDALLNISFFNCEMIVAIDNLYSLPIAGVILPRDSPLQTIFEYGYSTIKDIGYTEMGVCDFKLFLESAIRNQSKNKQLSGCYRRKLKPKSALKKSQLHLQTLQFLFWLFSGGVCVAVVVLIVELIFSKRS